MRVLTTLHNVVENNELSLLSVLGIEGGIKWLIENILITGLVP
jgi:hypothetical protein